jgi:potassium efflux system protein
MNKHQHRPLLRLQSVPSFFRVVIDTVVLAIFLFCFGPAAAAPIPGFSSNNGKPASTDNSKKNDLPIDQEKLIEEIQINLKGTKKELSRVLSDVQSQAAADEKARSGLNTRRFYLEMLIRNYEGQLERLAEIDELRQRNAIEQEEAGKLSGSEVQDLPFLEEDRQRGTAALLDKHITSLTTLLALMEKEIQRRINHNEENNARLRQADEEVVKARENPNEQAGLKEKRDILALQTRVGSARLVNVVIEKQLVAQKLLAAQRKRAIIAMQTSQAASPKQPTSRDIAVMRSDLENQRRAIMAELNSTLAHIDAEEQRKTFHPSAPEVEISELRQARNENAGFKLQTLYLILDLLQAQQFFWELRESYALAYDREQASEAYGQIEKGRSNLQVVRDYIEFLRQFALNRLAASDRDTGTAETFKASESKEALQAVYIDRIVIFSRALTVLESTENLIERWQQDLDERFRVKSVADKLQEFWLSLRAWGVSVWQYEILSAQDVTDVDGRKITIQRSITVEKSLTAVMILIFGYWLAVILTRLAERMAVIRYDMDINMARIARRWILFVVFIMLLTASLMVVHIPFTVFAFMGGALAIGAGFGMQNLLKNLISGLMLLLERPFRPGDLVEVGDIRGRITDIGVRSSQIRDANGIETLIPNSIFIEEKVTNWTLSSSTVRISVKVGVAYGSPEQEVADLLLQAAGRHGLVLDKPAPQVLFEDFGNDALVFGLYIWIELKPTLDWRVVASDLRYIISKSFAAKGIAIAFPQRDIHLDAKQPLAVRILGDS